MDNQITGKYLPIGTVVLLKGGTKRLMITGFCVSSEEKKDEIWDYVGCLYPEGVLSTGTNCVFDHNQISKIIYMGLIDDEEKNFKKLLTESISKMEEEKQNEKADSVINPLQENKEEEVPASPSFESSIEEPKTTDETIPLNEPFLEVGPIMEQPKTSEPDPLNNNPIPPEPKLNVDSSNPNNLFG